MQISARAFQRVFSIYLQKLASIQPTTSLVKFARSPRTDPPGFEVRVIFNTLKLAHKTLDFNDNKRRRQSDFATATISGRFGIAIQIPSDSKLPNVEVMLSPGSPVTEG